MNRKSCSYKTVCLAVLTCLGCFIALAGKAQDSATTTLLIHFDHFANGQPMVLSEGKYLTAFGEPYRVRKLKYYISFPELTGNGTTKSPLADPYFLIDLQKEQTNISLQVNPGSYSGLRFIAGIDSAANCSGAQAGALDPMNDMFWTWNSGYVVFKLEGESDSSRADLNRIEHHIGGYKGPNNVSREVKLGLPETVTVTPGKITHLYIDVNLDKYWTGTNELRISSNPLCTTSGALARKIAENIPGIFSIRKISQEP